MAILETWLFCVEIDREHGLVDHVGVHERDRTVGLLRDVVEDLATEIRAGGGCAERDQHLFARRADLDLLQRLFGGNVAALQRLADAAGGRHRDDKRHQPGAPQMPTSAPHLSLPLQAC